MLKIKTSRLELVAGTPELATAEKEDPAKFAVMLDARVPLDGPGGWPPKIWGEAMDDFLIRLRQHPSLTGWLQWYWVLYNERGRTLIGSGGFIGMPFNGEVMIGYSVLVSYQRKGYGTEAVKALAEWAFANPRVQKIAAETFPDLTASIRLLDKCGFVYIGKGFEMGTVRYVLTKDKWQLQSSV